MKLKCILTNRHLVGDILKRPEKAGLCPPKINEYEYCNISPPQAIMSTKPEGDSRLQELKRRGQSLCGQDLEEHKKQELKKKVRGAEEQWMRVMRDAKRALDQAERQRALDGQLRGFKELSQNTKSWLEDKKQSLVSLGGQADPEKTISTAQVSLNNRSKDYTSVFKYNTVIKQRMNFCFFILRPS